MAEPTDIIYSIRLRGGSCPGLFEQFLRPREKRATVKFRPGAEVNEASTQFILVKFGLDPGIFDQFESCPSFFYLQWTRRSPFAPTITTPLGIYPSEKVEITFNDNHYLERKSSSGLFRLGSDFGKMMRTFFTSISATGKRLLLPKHTKTEICNVRSGEKPRPEPIKLDSGSWRLETPQPAMALTETRQAQELDDRRHLRPDCFQIPRSLREVRSGNHEQAPEEPNTIQTAAIELIHIDQAGLNIDRFEMLVAASECDDSGVEADEVDQHWEWDAKERKFRHWEDSEKQWIYCPDSFD